MPTEDTMTIGPGDVAVLELRTNEIKPSPLPVALTLAQLKPGMLVTFVDIRLNVHPTCTVDGMHESNIALMGKPAMVIAVEPDKPGKTVALCLKEKTDGCHSCDGRVPDGHGAYALPGHLYTVAAHERHALLAQEALLAQDSINEMLKGFVKP